MTVRISSTVSPSQTIIKIDGRLKDVDLEDLTELLRSIRGTTSLDLAELQSVDRAAADLLREQLEAGVELRSISPYVALMLNSPSQRHGPSGKAID